MKLIKKILLPVAPLYYLVMYLRNKCYDWGIFTSIRFKLPLVVVGNLTVGGTGKTPMVEYLVRLLSKRVRLASLSRGYGRKSKGFVLANASSSVSSIGDEPYQISKKFKDILVAVDGNRVRGINHLIQLETPPGMVILDDAFQHRKVKAGFYVLLTSYQNLFSKDWILPLGNLREPRTSAKRADVIIVTKTPTELSEMEKQKIKKSLKVSTSQSLFFSTIEYDSVVHSKNSKRPLTDLIQDKFTLVTGIANPKPMVDWLAQQGYRFEHIVYPDHHNFTSKEMGLLESKKLVLTTEKDFWRLSELNHDQLYYLPIKTEIENSEKFDALVLDFIASYNL